MAERPGPTGRYPRGKIAPHDSGELNAAVGWSDDGHVVLDFATPVSWIAMSVAEARTFAASLCANADRAEAALKRN